jgi:hypothetical protein
MSSKRSRSVFEDEYEQADQAQEEEEVFHSAQEDEDDESLIRQAREKVANAKRDKDRQQQQQQQDPAAASADQTGYKPTKINTGIFKLMSSAAKNDNLYCPVCSNNVPDGCPPVGKEYLDMASELFHTGLQSNNMETAFNNISTLWENYRRTVNQNIVNKKNTTYTLLPEWTIDGIKQHFLCHVKKIVPFTLLNAYKIQEIGDFIVENCAFYELPGEERRIKADPTSVRIAIQCYKTSADMLQRLFVTHAPKTKGITSSDTSMLVSSNRNAAKYNQHVYSRRVKRRL